MQLQILAKYLFRQSGIRAGYRVLLKTITVVKGQQGVSLLTAFMRFRNFSAEKRVQIFRQISMSLIFRLHLPVQS